MKNFTRVECEKRNLAISSGTAVIITSARGQLAETHDVDVNRFLRDKKKRCKSYIKKGSRVFVRQTLEDDSVG